MAKIDMQRQGKLSRTRITRDSHHAFKYRGRAYWLQHQRAFALNYLLAPWHVLRPICAPVVNSKGNPPASLSFLVTEQAMPYCAFLSPVSRCSTYLPTYLPTCLPRRHRCLPSTHNSDPQVVRQVAEVAGQGSLQLHVAHGLVQALVCTSNQRRRASAERYTPRADTGHPRDACPRNGSCARSYGAGFGWHGTAAAKGCG
jgi:hypothetical protein